MAVGYSTVNGYQDFAVVRYNADGSLDTTFNGTGKLTTDIGTTIDSGNSVAIQIDGRIVVAGDAGVLGLAVVRYNANGTLDMSFNGTGKVTTTGASGNSVVLQNDGKIVVAGGAIIGSDEQFTIVRYNSNGTLDTSFNGTGKVTTGFGGGGARGASLALQNDGKIVVIGWSWNGNAEDFALARYLSDGSLDTTFNGTGKVTTAIGSGSDIAAETAGSRRTT